MKVFTSASQILLLLTLFIFSSCEAQRDSNKVLGTWVVEEFRINNKDLLWDSLSVNMASFDKSGKCELPRRKNSEKAKADWKIKKINDFIFLSITNSKDTFYNKDFRINFSSRMQGDATIKIMELKAENLYWKCSQ